MNSPFKYSITQHLLRNKSFLGEKSHKKSLNFLLGFRKDFVVYDLENALVTFFKVLNLIDSSKKQKFRILFIGSPLKIEKKVQKLLSNSRHVYIKPRDWVSGKITNQQNNTFCPDLIIVFNQKSLFSEFESLKKNIPLVSFTEENKTFLYVDYPIVLDLNSKGIIDIFFLLIKRSL